MASAVFFLVAWALSIGLQPFYTSFTWITYLGISGVGLAIMTPPACRTH